MLRLGKAEMILWCEMGRLKVGFGGGRGCLKLGACQKYYFTRYERPAECVLQNFPVSNLAPARHSFPINPYGCHRGILPEIAKVVFPAYQVKTESALPF